MRHNTRQTKSTPEHIIVHTSMQRLKNLCIILLITFFVSGVINSGWYFAQGWSEGANIASHLTANKLDGRSYLTLNVYNKLEIPENNDINQLTGDSVWIVPNNVSIHEFSDHLTPLTAGQKILQYTLSGFNIMILVLNIIIVVVFVKILIRFTRAKVFESDIIRLLNHIGFYFLLLAALASLWEIGRHYYASLLVDIDHLSIAYFNCVDWGSILIGLVIMVMTEILRKATTMKEEQDLTI